MPTIEKPPESTDDGKELLELWERRLELACKKLKDKGGDIKEGGWKKLVTFFEGDQWTEKKDSKGRYHRITANQAKSNIDAIRPQLYFNNPKVRIRLKNPSVTPAPILEMGPPQFDGIMSYAPAPVIDPATGQPVVRVQAGRPVAIIGGQQVDAQEQVELIEAVDNYVFEDTGLKSIVKRIINDALILPYGIHKWEWVEEVEEQEVAEEGLDGETKIRTEERVVRSYARPSRVQPWLFVWDTDLQEFDLDKASWYAEIKFVTKEDLEAMPDLE